MDIIKIIAVGIITSFSTLIVKQTKPEISILINLAGSILIVIMIINSLTSVINNFSTIFARTGITNNVLSPILKIVGVGYICEFSSDICNDTGSSSLAEKIVFAGKIIILLLALPIVNKVIDIVVGLL
ncbi:MAG: SpoIIIAC/SpoIIIAD family protein [Clostridia bacterium]|nr:SpoIIIAC/SpoIIIAD family protein [Clostridia bacterium]